jgi:hypothetical protein
MIRMFRILEELSSSEVSTIQKCLPGIFTDYQGDFFFSFYKRLELCPDKIWEWYIFMELVSTSKKKNSWTLDLCVDYQSVTLRS